MLAIAGLLALTVAACALPPWLAGWRLPRWVWAVTAATLLVGGYSLAVRLANGANRSYNPYEEDRFQYDFDRFLAGYAVLLPVTALTLAMLATALLAVDQPGSRRARALGAKRTVALLTCLSLVAALILSSSAADLHAD